MKRSIAVLWVLSILGAACGGSETATTPVLTTLPTTTILPTTTTTLPSSSTTTPPTTVATTITLPPAGPARYRLTVENTWSEATHPGQLPSDAHFSWLAGATHDAHASIWAIGEPSSPGVTEMAETGRTGILVDEINAADGIGTALDWPWWFCPSATQNSKCGELAVEFDIDPEFPYVTLAAMIGPSPDWFVGVDHLPLLEDGQWTSEVVVPLAPHDGGTRTSNRFALFGPRNDPPEPITVVTVESAQLIGPQQIGTYTFTLMEP